MPRVDVYDVPGGNPISYDLVDESTGLLQCTFGRNEDEHLKDFWNIRNIKCRDGDLLINSYPKSGTNWMYEIVTLLTTKSSKITGKSKITEMIESMPTGRVDGLTSPRILNSHLRIRYLPQDAFNKKIKMFLVLRNPKDVVVSFYHHTRGLKLYGYEGKFENFLQAFLRGEVECGPYRTYMLEWQQFIRDNPDFPLLVIYYEDLVQDLLNQVKRIREFLELDITDRILEDICKSLAFNEMKKGKEDAMTDADREFMSNFTRPEFSFLRKGKIGDWKNYFTVEQNKSFDEWWTNETKDVERFKFRFE